MRLFLIVAISLFLLSTWFASATWARFAGMAGRGWKIAPLVMTLGFVATSFLARASRHPVNDVLVTIFSVWLGFLSYAIAAALLCWICLGVAKLTGISFDRRFAAQVIFSGAVLATVYGLANAQWIRITRTTVELAGLPAEWEGREVALVSDLHLGNIRSRDFSQRIVDKLNALAPEAVFVAGDVFDGGKIDYDYALSPWVGLKARRGVYAVTGNHDEFRDRAEGMEAMKRAGMRVLANEKIQLSGLQVVGVLDRESRSSEAYRALLESLALDRDKPSLLVVHQPINLDIAEKAGIDLQFSGHTHNGQFWPWNWLVRWVHGRYAYGLNEHGALQVLTSSGVGTWGPPLRVATKAEIVLVKLTGAAR